MFASLLYLPTIAYIPHSFYLSLLLYIIINKKPIQIDSNLKILFGIIFFTLINRLIFLDNYIFIPEKETILNILIPGTTLILISYIISKHLTKKDLNIIIYLIAFESIFVIIEFYFGKTTFFTDLKNFKEISNINNTLLYSFRPMGLSTNSSIIAIKLFFGFLILHHNKEYLKKYIKIPIFIILFLALIMTFNRTAIISVLLFYILLYLNFLFLKPNKNILHLKLVSVITILFFLGIIYISYSDIILHQFNRNGTDDILTGRTEIWHTFIMFIENHFIFGNGSYKLYLPFFHGYWKYAHAHNSYLELLATHGIIIFILLMFFFLKNINLKNYYYILPIFTFSLTQYFIGWNISFQDILFFYFLTEIHSKRL